MLDFQNTIAIVRACVSANRADLIEDALFERKTASEVSAMIASAGPARPAASSGHSAFGPGPTPEQRDAIAASLKKRFAAMSDKSAG